MGRETLHNDLRSPRTELFKLEELYAKDGFEMAGWLMGTLGVELCMVYTKVSQERALQVSRGISL